MRICGNNLLSLHHQNKLTMKLLLCKECSDVFSITFDDKKCGCGKTTGKYLDNINATYSGPAVPLGFNNRTLISSVIEFEKTGEGRDFTAFVIGSDCKTFVKK